LVFVIATLDAFSFFLSGSQPGSAKQSRVSAIAVQCEQTWSNNAISSGFYQL
jgi:hypothetical protein